MNYGALNQTDSTEPPIGNECARVRLSRFATVGLTISVALAWGTIGCHKTSAQNPSAFSYAGGQYAASQYPGDPQDAGQPDYGNLAPVDGQYPTQNEAQQQAIQYQQGAPIERRYPGADAGAY